MTEPDSGRRDAGRWSRLWPWLVLAALAVPAVWHYVDFPEDVDPEFPSIARPTFSSRPPPAYRLAEPGDTIDRVAIYLSAAALLFSATGCVYGMGRGWYASTAAAAAAFWHAATPGPTFDGWHGLGWRAVLDPSAPFGLRIALAGAALALGAGIVVPLAAELRMRRRPRDPGLLIAALVLVALRQFEIPGVEPAGYWPRWAFVWGIAAWDMVLIRRLAEIAVPSRPRLWSARIGVAAGWGVLVVLGILATRHHRPLSRLRTVEPGRIYISAMPTRAGLKTAYERHRFKTIINVFAEDTDQRSPLLPDELAFVKEHGLRYLNAPAEQSGSDEFLDETLRLARDPDAWPILVHCHGCMDRSPAWMGIYRFLIQKRSIGEIMREIEGHRGYRPKALVTLLFNRVLLARDRDRYLADPDARRLLDSAEGTVDPYYANVRRERERAESRRTR